MDRRSSHHKPTAWAATIGGAVLLVVAGCSGTIRGSAAPVPGSTAPTGQEVALQVRDFTLEPKDVTVHGSTLALQVTNTGPTVHNVTIRDAAGKTLVATPDLRPGEAAPLTGTLPPGSYVLFCSLPGHESLGIHGTLTVTK